MFESELKFQILKLKDETVLQDTDIVNDYSVRILMWQLPPYGSCITKLTLGNMYFTES